jgi:uncharacterized protein
MRPLTLVVLPHAYAICQLAEDAVIPLWADGPGFVSITRSDGELTIVCDAGRVPADIKTDAPWTCFKFQGPFDFGDTGIVAAIVSPISAKRIGLFVVCTFDRDYLLVHARDTEAAISAIEGAGHRVIRS